MKRLPPKERKPFMAINALSKIFHNNIHALAEEFGLNDSYRHLLFHLAHGDGMTQLQLARATNLKPPTVSITLQKMEAEGYVERRQDEMDLRAVRVYLTDKGRAFDDASRKLVDMIDQKAMEGFSANEIRVLMELLDRIYDNLTEQDGSLSDKRNCRGHVKGGER